MHSSKIVSTHKSRSLYTVITQTHRPSSHVEIKYLFYLYTSYSITIEAFYSNALTKSIFPLRSLFLLWVGSVIMGRAHFNCTIFDNNEKKFDDTPATHTIQHIYTHIYIAILNIIGNYTILSYLLYIRLYYSAPDILCVRLHTFWTSDASTF